MSEGWTPLVARALSVPMDRAEVQLRKPRAARCQPAELPQRVAVLLQEDLLHLPAEGLQAALQPVAISQPEAELLAEQLLGAQPQVILQLVAARPLPALERGEPQRVVLQPAERLPQEVPARRVAYRQLAEPGRPLAGAPQRTLERRHLGQLNRAI